MVSKALSTPQMAPMPIQMSKVSQGLTSAPIKTAVSMVTIGRMPSTDRSAIFKTRKERKTPMTITPKINPLTSGLMAKLRSVVIASRTII